MRTLSQSVLTKEQQKSSEDEEMERFKRTTGAHILSVEDLEKAELAIIRDCQQRTFPEELACLEKGQPSKATSHLRKLCPQFLDGVLRVGGRLSKLSMSVEAKHPIILSKVLHITELLLQHVHRQVGDAGRNRMLSKLRERYWVTGARRSMVNRYGVIFTCLAIRAIHIEVHRWIQTLL